MKLFKSTIFGLAALALGSMAFTGCQDDIDAPVIDSPVAKSTPNTTLAEFKEMFWQDDNNYCVHAINPDDPEARIIIHGRVISSDEEGNVFKFLCIQDETAALTFSIDSYNLYLNYRQGQEIVMDVTDMYVGKYAGLQQMGDSSYYDVQKTPQVTFMSLERFQSRAELNGIPELSKIDTLQVETFSDLDSSPETQRKYQSQLVRLKNVYFEDAGQKKFSEYHVNTNEAQNRNIIDRNGNTLTVRTSGYSTFWNELLPSGNLDITGILTYFNGNWRLVLNNRQGVVAVGDRPGTKEKPYGVDDVIALEASGNTDKGWVKGYIVGAAAPEVENISSNADIEWEAPTVLANTLVIGATTATNDYTKVLVVALPPESALREYGNLREHPENLGKEILIQGTFDKYMGTYGITGNNGTLAEFVIEGVSIETGEFAEGSGSEESPYNCAQIVALNPSSTTDAVQTGVWVKGYIVGSMPTGGSSTTLSGTNFNTTDAATTNLVLGPTPDCTDYTKCVGIQLGTGIRDALSLATKPGNLGKVLAIKGDVMKYCGGPGIKNGSSYKLDGEGQGGGGDTPVVGTPTGEGTLESPYNVAKALEVIAAGPAETEVYVIGTITAIKEVSTSFGNATYTISDKDVNNALGVYRGYWIDGAKFTSTDQIAVGAEVVVKGQLVNYAGNTPQFTTGNQIVTYNGEGGGNQGGDDPNPPTPPTPGEGVEVLATAMNVPGVTTVDGYSIDIEKAGGATAPIVHDSSASVRVYAKGTIQVTGAKMAKIVFTMNTGTMKYRYTTLTPSTGTITPAQAAGDETVTWVGDATDVTFTVGELGVFGSESTKPGQFHFTKIQIIPAE